MLTIDQLRTYSGDGAYPLFTDCGKLGYRKALSLQEEIQGRVIREELPAVMLFVEHPPVITLGIRKDNNRLLSSEQILRSEGIETVPIRRGGGATAHNPGQLVIYPIIDLARTGFRVAPYVKFLEQTGIELLAGLGVKADRRNRYPGLWIGEKKIASVGVQLNHGVTMHGIAINLYNDLGIFGHIIPCGIEGVLMTNVLHEGGEVISMDEAKHRSRKIIEELLSEKVRRATS